MMLITKDGQQENAVANYQYELTEWKVDEGADLRYTTYGIRALDKNNKVVCEYRDVGTSRPFVQRIVDQCNQMEVDALHLEDILLDTIG